MTHPPARCPGCGLPAKLALAFNPTMPVYLCGSTPARIVCATPPSVVGRGEPELPNVVAATDEELRELVVLELLPSYYVTAHPVIGLCRREGCEQTAIDGWCLEHEEQIAAAVRALEISERSLGVTPYPHRVPRRVGGGPLNDA